MIRALLPSVTLFLLPFAIYALWLLITRRRGRAEEPAGGWLITWVAAVVLALAAFALFTDFAGADPDAVYVPPHYQNGAVVPGRFVKPGDGSQ